VVAGVSDWVATSVVRTVVLPVPVTRSNVEGGERDAVGEVGVVVNSSVVVSSI